MASEVAVSSRDRMVYLDYNATTPVEDEVVQEISDVLKSAWGNPSSGYAEGELAKKAISTAREHVARMVGTQSSDDVIFTSGGTEANALVFHSVLKNFHTKVAETGDPFCDEMKKPHFITCEIEHPSVKLALEKMRDDGVLDLTLVGVSSKTQTVSPSDIVSALRPSTVLISLMLANNETGIIQPVREVAAAVRACKRGPGNSRVYVHTDAAQALGKIPVDVADLGVDYLTIVGHKFYGPRIGALYVRGPGTETPVVPMMVGGGQERGFRPGTENTAMIAGLGKAAELVCERVETYELEMRGKRDYLLSKLLAELGDRVVWNGPPNMSLCLPNTCNVSISSDGHMSGADILGRCKHVQASIGAACHAQNKPSAILLTCGISRETASAAIRLSVGRHTTLQDIDIAVVDIVAAVKS